MEGLTFDVDVDPATPGVFLLGGLVLRERFTVTVDGPELPVLVALHIAHEDGRLVCESVTCTRRRAGEEVSGDTFRHLPIAHLLREAIRAAKPHVLRGDVSIDGALLGTGLPALPQPADIKPTHAVLQHVAVAHRRARLLREPEKRAVADSLGVPTWTAERLIARAREKGLLPPP